MSDLPGTGVVISRGPGVTNLWIGDGPRLLEDARPRGTPRRMSTYGAPPPGDRGPAPEPYDPYATTPQPPPGSYPPPTEPASRFSRPERHAHPEGPGFTERAAEAAGRVARHVRTPETKEFFKTSEFGVWLAVSVLILLSAAIVGGDAVDAFTAEQAWRYVAIVTAAYVLSRGISKAGTRRDPADLGRSQREGANYPY